MNIIQAERNELQNLLKASQIRHQIEVDNLHNRLQEERKFHLETKKRLNEEKNHVIVLQHSLFDVVATKDESLLSDHIVLALERVIKTLTQNKNDSRAWKDKMH